MNLNELQVGVLDLIKSRHVVGINDSTGYFLSVKGSKELLVVRKVALWWRTLQIESFCTLSSALLKYENCFNDAVTSFYNSSSFSPYRDEVGIQFLDYLQVYNSDAFVRTVSSFELALIQCKKGKAVSLSQTWEYEPYTIISGLLQNAISKEHFVKGSYLVEVCSGNAELFTVTPFGSHQ
ncbi:MAG TPA: hypothetical protein VFU05_17550 [Cyclobacteriaceae bacterium]|nr:hypothetical protein [Cyclobacteriaceae bacterium]